MKEKDFDEEQLEKVKKDFQYAFLALDVHQFIIDFMIQNKQLRSDSIRALFSSQKLSPEDKKKHKYRLRFALVLLLTYKKCYEILIKFIYKNHTTKQ